MEIKNKTELERRTVQIKELRVIDSNEPEQKETVIEGYAAVFDSWSESLGGSDPFIEKVCKGAFEQTIREDDIRALFNHDPNYVLGRNKSSTLELFEDEKGLIVRIKPPETQWAKDLIISIARGDINQMSFGFTVEEDKWSIENEMDVRELKTVKLFDVSPVTFPAYSQTECGIRSKEEIYKHGKKLLNEKRNKEKLDQLVKLKLKKEKIKFI